MFFKKASFRYLGKTIGWRRKRGCVYLIYECIVCVVFNSLGRYGASPTIPNISMWYVQTNRVAESARADFNIKNFLSWQL